MRSPWLEQTISTPFIKDSEIMTTDKPFGGLSIIAVGDLSQLLPIGQKPVYDFTSDL
jgi:hypothetical protein